MTLSSSTLTLWPAGTDLPRGSPQVAIEPDCCVTPTAVVVVSRVDDRVFVTVLEAVPRGT